MEPHSERLRALLSEEGVSPASVGRLAGLCEDWYAAAPAAASFLFRSIFRELAASWDDQQGIDAALHAPFRDDLLPAMLNALTLLPNAHPGQALALLDSVAASYQRCRY